MRERQTSVPAAIRKTWLVVVALLLASVPAWASDYLSNGDFEQGNKGFLTDYAYRPGGWTTIGCYAVGTNPANYNNYHWQAASYGDHTTGTGQMMIVDGAASSGLAVWEQTVAVLPNTQYEFSGWAASAFRPPAPSANLQLQVNGIDTGNPLALPDTPGTWSRLAATWSSGTTTTAAIRIVDLNTSASGNDFCLDDIQLKPIAQPKPKYYGVFVGSNDYIWGTNIIKLNGQADATKVYQKFNDLLSFSAAQLLTYERRDGDTKTPRQEVFNALDMMGNLVKPGDGLVFFYSGHGTGSLTRPAERESLYINDYPVYGELYDTELAEYFLDPTRKDTWASVDKLFILDSCHSGGFWDASGEGQRPNLNALDKVALLAGASELNYTVSDPFMNFEGVFSEVLESALTMDNGWAYADTDKNGLSVAELKSFLELHSWPALGYIKRDWPDEPITVNLDFGAQQSADFRMVIPEPATLALMALGGLAVLLRKRR